MARVEIGSRPVCGSPPAAASVSVSAASGPAVVAAEPALVPGVAAEPRGVVGTGSRLRGRSTPSTGLALPRLVRSMLRLLRRVVPLRLGLLVRRLVGSRGRAVSAPRCDHRVDVDGAQRIVPIVVRNLPTHVDAPSPGPITPHSRGVSLGPVVVYPRANRAPSIPMSITPTLRADDAPIRVARLACRLLGASLCAAYFKHWGAKLPKCAHPRC